jgi:hypothetical protein
MLPRPFPSSFPSLAFVHPVPRSAFEKITNRIHFAIMNYPITITVYSQSVQNHPEKRAHFKKLLPSRVALKSPDISELLHATFYLLHSHKMVTDAVQP